VLADYHHLRRLSHAVLFCRRGCQHMLERLIVGWIKYSGKQSRDDVSEGSIFFAYRQAMLSVSVMKGLADW